MKPIALSHWRLGCHSLRRLSLVESETSFGFYEKQLRVCLVNIETYITATNCWASPSTRWVHRLEGSGFSSAEHISSPGYEDGVCIVDATIVANELYNASRFLLWVCFGVTRHNHLDHSLRHTIVHQPTQSSISLAQKLFLSPNDNSK